jgi:hypothetical protein
MELYKFINNNNITDYEYLKSVLESESFNLKIKDDIDYPNLFLIHTCDNSIFSNKIVNECNGIILEKDTLKIICYTFDKCNDSINYLTTGQIDLDKLYKEPSLEGTLIRLYFYNNNWMLSTKKCIDSSKSRWISDKNFKELFLECFNNYDINILNKDYCYSFIITHPENKIVINYTDKKLVHISTRDMISLKEIDIDVGLTKLNREYVDKNSLENIINHINTSTDLSYEGYIFIDTSFNRLKIKSPYYNHIRELWGNTNNRLYRYIELRKNINILNEYLYYYKDDYNLFHEYENTIKKLSKFILFFYYKKHVMKENIIIPFFIKNIIYELHGSFFKDKIKTNNIKVMLKFLDLEPKKLCFMLNKFKEHKEHKELENKYDNIGQDFHSLMEQC